MTVAELTDIFRRAAEQHEKIHAFTYMTESRLLRFQPADIDYPMLMLEPPDIGYTNNENGLLKMFSGTFSVLAYCRTDDDPMQDYFSAETENISRQLIMRLLIDAPALGLVILPEDFRLQAVRGYTHDNLFGWQVMYRIYAPASECDDDVWYPRNALLRRPPLFAFTNDAADSFSLTVVVADDAPEDTALYATVDGVEQEIAPTGFESQFKDPFLCLAAKTSQKTIAYAIVRPKVYSGESIYTD